MNNYSRSTTYTSPFHAYPNERLVPEPTGTGACRLTEFDRLLLQIINRVLVTTSLLLYRYLEAAGLRNADVEDIRKGLSRLSESGYLTRLRFYSPEGRSNLTVYTLAQKGRDFIRSTGKLTPRIGYIDHMDSLHAKRQLAALQFIIARDYVPEATQTSYGRLIRDLRDDTGSHLFRTQAVVETRQKTIFVEVVRDCSGATEELKKKLKRIRDTINSDLLNLTGSQNYEVVIVAESHPHMKRLMQELEGALQADIRGKLVFTNDQDTFCRNKQLYRLPERQNFRYKLPENLTKLFGLQT